MPPMLRSLIPLLLCLLLPACGGGGGGSDDNGGAQAAGSGTVALLVRDAPMEGIEALIVTITSAELLGNGAPVTIFEGRRRVNLLEFREQEFMLTLYDRVPVGSYDKIRLQVEDPAIEPNPGNLPVRIPGNGKLDLNPREAFRVAEGSFLTIRIDWDANNSVHVVGTGSGRINVRPVIFVEVEENFPAPIDLSDFSGAVLARNLDEGSLLVDVDGRAGEVTVMTDADTTIFDAEVERARLSAIEVGDRVLIRGSLQRSRDVIADVIFRGDPLRLRGELPDGTRDDPFPFEIDPGQEIAGSVHATLVEGARSYVEDGPEIQLDELEPGARARLTGRFFSSAALYRVGLLDLEPIVSEAVIESVDLGSQPATITVRNEDDSVVVFTISRDTQIRLVGGAELGAADLAAGQSVEIRVDGELGGFPFASLVLVDSLRWEGTVVRVSPGRREILLAPDDGSPELVLSIRPDAAILLVENDTATMIELEDVSPGDSVDALGLLSSSGDPIVYTLLVGL
jgi:hypothetical protein